MSWLKWSMVRSLNLTRAMTSNIGKGMIPCITKEIIKQTSSMAVVPEYVSKELQDLDQPLQYNLISCVKSGLKSGRKLSNTDSRWVEKWFEVKCKDISENAEKN